jgi:excisionase family DNA binding protein
MERRAWPLSDGTEMPGTAPLHSDRDVIADAKDVGRPGPNNTASVASPQLLLSVPEAARALGIARSSLYVLMDRHELTSVSIGRRRLLPARALEDYVDRLIERSTAGPWGSGKVAG